mgnify:FL=1
MKKGIALALIVAGVLAAIYGFQLYQDANADVSFLGLEISASDSEATSQSYLYFGAALVAFVAGGYMMRNR